MKRREALIARDENRAPRILHAWDYLLGVQDQTRQGALRFRLPDTNQFLAAEPLAAPPSTSLGELAKVARELSSTRIDDLDELRRWLAVLVAPGASLGGARPKANFTDRDGSLWLGKFPARDDERDVGAWEYVLHRLGSRAGLEVPPARLVRLGKDFHTFCSRRFDRVNGCRRFYASAMTLLRRAQSEGSSYIELAQFIQNQGDPAFLRSDLEQLFRRVLFNVMVGNRDDHLRNHGFILGAGGWRLAPAFDMNPNIDKVEHVINLDDARAVPDVETALATCDFYRVEARAARTIADDIAGIVDGWRDAAARVKISSADISLTEAAFGAHAAYRRRR